ncbi:MAG: SMP-30/gluconolactonase/LRE family protein [Betaproteobacteria bacterium]|nr:MAG: SMP-30/gluconolactonase/LRE family protein [Betaproteobacteria bacterium]
MEKLSAKLVLDARAELGECVRWDHEAKLVYWVDINRNQLHRFNPATGENQSMDIGQNIGCFAQDKKGGFIAGLRTGYARITHFGGDVIALTSPDYDPSKARFNDGRCDNSGRFWAGTMWEPRDRAGGVVYCLESDGEFRAGAVPTVITNAITFSADGKTMTLSDTPNHVLWAFDYDEATATPSNQRVLRRYDRPAVDGNGNPPGYGGRPDGACVDSEGNVYVACIQGSRVEKISPSGELLAVIELPVPCPTCCTFGGEDLRTLYIVTGRIRMSEDQIAATPEAGGIFAVRLEAPHAPGILEPRFAG